NCWSTVNANPAAGSCGTTIDHRAHTAKPRNSAKTEIHRLRVATFRPPSRQNVGSSGSQRSIHRPERWVGTVAVRPAVGAVVGPTAVVAPGAGAAAVVVAGVPEGWSADCSPSWVVGLVGADMAAPSAGPGQYRGR